MYYAQFQTYTGVTDALAQLPEVIHMHIKDVVMMIVRQWTILITISSVLSQNVLIPKCTYMPSNTIPFAKFVTNDTSRVLLWYRICNSVVAFI